MSSFNKVIIMGRLTRDIDLKSINNGTSLAEIGIAVNERRKDRDGKWTDAVHFVEVTFWGKKAEVMSQYLEKGQPVLIEGKLRQDRWESNGQNYSKLKVHGEQFSFVGSRQYGSEVIHQKTDIDKADRTKVTIPDDDIPF
jgi:single-strand DNA-binding protein